MALGGINEQSDQEFLIDFYMKQLTVEEEKGGIAMSRKAQITVYPALEWFDDLGVHCDLTLLWSAVDCRSKHHWMPLVKATQVFQGFTDRGSLSTTNTIGVPCEMTFDVIRMRS